MFYFSNYWSISRCSEADEEIASLANGWKCPVIGEDSDFFIFDLKGGYIPLKKIDLGSEPPRAQSFRIERLANHLGISRELLPLVASVLGNDFVSDDVHQILCQDLEIDRPFYFEKILSKITNFLKTRGNTNSKLEDALQTVLDRVSDQDRHEVQKALERSIKSYKDCGTVLATYFETGEVPTSKHKSHATRETWVLEKIRQGLFPLIFMEVLAVGRKFLQPQVEDFDAPAADQCSLELRRFLYGFLGNREDGKTDVEEHYRSGKKLTQRTVQPRFQPRKEESTKGKLERTEVKRGEEPVVKCKVQSADHKLRSTGHPLTLATIPFVDEGERLDVVLSILESNTHEIRNLPRGDLLFVASVRYWIKHAQPRVHESHLRALLLCYVTLAKGEHNQDVTTRLEEDEFDLAAQHNFAQWQCVMHEALNVNFVLQEPLPTPRIWSLYDGLLVQRLVRDFRPKSRVDPSIGESKVH